MKVQRSRHRWLCCDKVFAQELWVPAADISQSVIEADISSSWDRMASLGLKICSII